MALDNSSTRVLVLVYQWYSAFSRTRDTETRGKICDVEKYVTNWLIVCGREASGFVVPVPVYTGM